jgi:VanZ family protein
VKRLADWLPPIAWMTVVLSASSAEFSAANTGSLIQSILAWLLPGLTQHHVDVIHGVTRKLAHFTEYAILGALWFRGLARSGAARPPVAAWLALVISVACAVVDETHQSFVPSRTGSAHDVLLDSMGGGRRTGSARARYRGRCQRWPAVGHRARRHRAAGLPETEQRLAKLRIQRLGPRGAVIAGRCRHTGRRLPREPG